MGAERIAGTGRDHAYPGGFAFARVSDLAVPDTYEPTELPGGWTYWADILAERQVWQSDGRFVIVHGLAVYAGEVSPDNVAEFLWTKWQISEDEFERALCLLGGRYAVVIGSTTFCRVYPDPAGARSIYFALGRSVVSSHANMLAELGYGDDRWDSVVRPTMLWNLSPYVGVEALLPNHYLDVLNGHEVRYFPRSPNRFVEWSDEERLRRIEVIWSRQLSRVSRRDIALSVTGGGDSRVLLAMAKAYRSQYKTFTYVARNESGRWGRSLARDGRIVEQLLQYVELEHQFLGHEDVSSELSGELGGLLDRTNIQEHGRWLIPLYRRAFPGGRTLHMRGTLLEIGRAYWAKRPAETADGIRGLALGYAKSRGSVVERLVDEGIKRFGYDRQMWGYDRRDLYYWETRIGRWFAECLNETDAAFDTFLPLNVREILELLLSFDWQKRRDGHAYWELINRNDPVLNFVGKNDERNLYEQWRDHRLANVEQKLREGRSVPADSRLEGVFDVFRLYDPKGALISKVPIKDRSIFIPEEHGHAGVVAAVETITPDEAGTVGIGLWNGYGHAIGKKYFELQICVNGAIVFREDGNAWTRPTIVTLANVSPKTEISVRVVMLRDVTGDSWERATRTRVEHIDFTSGAVLDGEVRISSSSPVAEVGLPPV